MIPIPTPAIRTRSRGVAYGTLSQAAGNVGVGVLGNYGSLRINADGSYLYTVDNGHATVQALRTTADTLVEVFTYTQQTWVDLARQPKSPSPSKAAMTLPSV